MKKFLSLISIIILCSLTACRSAEPISSATDQSNSEVVQSLAVEPTAKPESIIFMAGYKPQANLPNVGVYVAKAKGFFADENLEVDVQHSSGGGESVQLITTGKIQVTNMDAAVLMKRRADPGLPIVSIALIGQRGQQAFAALASSGMKTPKDWEGKKVGYKGTPPPDLFALISAAGADLNKIELINVGYDPRLLVQGSVDVYPLFKSNEPYLLRQWGYDIILWDAADYGVPTLGLTYVTSDEILKNNPAMLTRFLRAVLRGIEYATENRDEAIDIVLTYTGPETDRDHMRFMLDTEILDMESDVTRQYGLGWQTHEQWAALAEVLMKYDAMPAVDVDSVFTTKILEAAQK